MMIISVMPNLDRDLPHPDAGAHSTLFVTNFVLFCGWLLAFFTVLGDRLCAWLLSTMRNAKRLSVRSMNKSRKIVQSRDIEQAHTATEDSALALANKVPTISDCPAMSMSCSASETAAPYSGGDIAAPYSQAAPSVPRSSSTPLPAATRWAQQNTSTAGDTHIDARHTVAARQIHWHHPCPGLPPAVLPTHKTSKPSSIAWRQRTILCDPSRLSIPVRIGSWTWSRRALPVCGNAGVYTTCNMQCVGVCVCVCMRVLCTRVYISPILLVEFEVTCHFFLYVSSFAAVSFMPNTGRSGDAATRSCGDEAAIWRCWTVEGVSVRRRISAYPSGHSLRPRGAPAAGLVHVSQALTQAPNAVGVECLQW
jgi:hypothetical protein